MRRLPQIILIVSTLSGCWLGMQAVHELGHVAGAWMTGGRVARVVLHPLTISRTDLRINPQPLVVVWMGPLVGAAIPLLLWAGAAAVKMRGAFVLRFFAGFCLVANGFYIGAGSLNGIGDAGEMLHCGSEKWHLWLYGFVTVPPGFWLWNGQGPQFGLGTARGEVDRRVAYGTLVASLMLLTLGFIVGGT